MKHPGRFLIVWGVLFVALMMGTRAFSAIPAHHFDAKFSLEYAASWNSKHPAAPITNMACLYFPQFSAKQAGVPPGASSAPEFVPAHEDCTVVERYKARLLCGEVAIKPRFDAANPDVALIAGTRLSCRDARAAISSIRHSVNAGRA